MQSFRTLSVVSTLFLAMIVAGCAPMVIAGSADVDKNAFGAKKRFAVVSIASYKTFRGNRA